MRRLVTPIVYMLSDAPSDASPSLAYLTSRVLTSAMSTITAVSAVSAVFVTFYNYCRLDWMCGNNNVIIQ